MSGGIQAGLEGLRRSELSVEKIAKRLAELPVTITGEPQDIVDLSAEAVALLTSQNAFEANLKSIETASEMAASTLDILG